MAITPLHPKYTSLLVVDDSPDDRAILERAVKTFGIKRSHFVATGEQALQFLRKQEVDIALIDYHLPGMNGVRLLEQLRSEFPRVDVVVVTGVRDERLAADVIKLGARDYLCKDEFVTGGIIRSLQAILRDRLATDEADLKETVASSDDPLAVASVEAKWLVEELSRHYQYDLARASLDGDGELKEASEAFATYLKAAFAAFPDAPVQERDDIVRMIAEQGMSPRQIALVYGLALRWLVADAAADTQAPPFTPALCLVQVLAQVVELYQSQLALSHLNSAEAEVALPRVA